MLLAELPVHRNRTLETARFMTYQDQYQRLI
jgi:hypothetical protein